MDPNAQDSAPRIAIVDGDPAVRNALAFCLELEGYAVEGFPSAEAAIDDLTGAACLVLDDKLPGIGGLQLIRTLRERGMTLPAILIVTNPTARLRTDASAAGVSIVEKPLLTEALEVSVRRALQAPA